MRSRPEQLIILMWPSAGQSNPTVGAARILSRRRACAAGNTSTRQSPGPSAPQHGEGLRVALDRLGSDGPPFEEHQSATRAAMRPGAHARAASQPSREIAPTTASHLQNRSESTALFNSAQMQSPMAGRRPSLGAPLTTHHRRRSESSSVRGAVVTVKRSQRSRSSFSRRKPRRMNSLVCLVAESCPCSVSATSRSGSLGN